MNALILSCSTGEGHNSAAKAIQEELKKRNINSYLVDALSFGNAKTSKIISGIFNNIAVGTPRVFGAMYKAGEFVSNDKLKSPVYLANLALATKLYKYIIDNDIDVVICSHLFPMETLTYLKSKHHLSIKCYAIVTDYTCIPFLEETKMDKYFIGHEDLLNEFSKKGISKDLLLPTGIPVSSKFSINRTKEYARKKLHLDLDKQIITIMTGGVGCGNVIEICNNLLNKKADNFQILVLVGKNKNLKEQLSIYKDIKAIDFTTQVSLYMEASDIILTKPGGLSITEISIKNVPMVITMPIPGCETKNAEFFVNKGMAVSSDTFEGIADSTIRILNSKKEQEKLVNNQKKQMNKQSARDICNYILNDL